MFRLKSLFYFVLVCLGTIFILTLSSTSAFAEAGIFIKDYAYQASKDDNKDSSRVIALREVKLLLLDELGTYLGSDTEVKNFRLPRNQIKTLANGVVPLEIVEEKWDGRVYRIKAKMAAKSYRIVQAINDLRTDRQKTQEMELLQRRSDQQLREIKRWQKELAAAKGGNQDGQKAAYDKLIKGLSSTDWLEKGYAAKNHQDFQGAIGAYTQAITLDPQNTQAYYARALISEKNPALQDYTKLLEIEPVDSRSHLIRAWTYKELEKRDLALAEFGKAIETAAGTEEKAGAYFDRGNYYTLSDHNLAIKDFSSAIALRPQDASSYFSRALSYSKIGKRDLALRDFTKAIEIDPQNSTYYNIRGIFAELDSPERSVADYSKAIELDPNTDNLMRRARIYLALGRYDLGINDCNLALELDNDSEDIYRLRTELYFRVGRSDLAMQDCNKIIKLNPQNAFAYYDRAQLHALKQDYQKSLDDLREAIKLKPSFKETAKKDRAFDKIRTYPAFINLVDGRKNAL